jgi:hypothetical protein
MGQNGKGKKGAVAGFLVERFPVELRRKVRAAATLQGKTLRDATIEALELWLRKGGK